MWWIVFDYFVKSSHIISTVYLFMTEWKKNVLTLGHWWPPPQKKKQCLCKDFLFASCLKVTVLKKDQIILLVSFQVIDFCFLNSSNFHNWRWIMKLPKQDGCIDKVSKISYLCKWLLSLASSPLRMNLILIQCLIFLALCHN